MTENNPMTKQQEQAPVAADATRVIRPAVDIFEDDTGITLQADMPGVTKERLDVRVEKETLSIAGDLKIDMPEGVEPVYADIRSHRYQRSFSLSRELATDQIEATLHNGVLILRIPLRKELQPCKIEVRVE
ncbi:MAG: Hsp20/alpha crystallin family protein [Gammaproteobacteria bacterium]|nr:Hsp20/alpha crystallin family protein [Gammaproteobacteria bacterium]MBU1653272.1 Hsp20/alpha crystallin family protein [Gammaproteobacteria bacterium]MBU1961498.1 Hsp20/alpha crystallin family protein [Gammaproteobacteria bacterium]